ncbi:GyrI-like domain-containing protein [Chondromyces crocatus]|uniref:GyrI-like small molecule binding domain-containing protein n=1 Tax=Chondromyces crocatus TaxID=52 RepID=A0A0K1EPC8_CHOCO|nr:GyrI-like domain-containing protein [Chondromyces crocatus]AKT42770.1 uncharacterized protein CMC5_069970 [Chondromyces crocatus]
MTTAIDFKKTADAYQGKRGEFRFVEVPDMRYLMLDGHGDPNTSEAFRGAVETLYPVAYKVKFASKQKLGRDYVVPPLEGLWWAEDMATFTSARDKSQWSWTLMLMVPSWVHPEMVDIAIEQVRAKDQALRLDDLRLELLSEGRCVQTLHVGSFEDEGPVLAHLHEVFIPEQGLSRVGKHHEIYLSDFRKVAPEKQRTLLRQPVAPRSATSASSAGSAR